MKTIAARRLPLIGAMTRDLERHGRLRPAKVSGLALVAAGLATCLAGIRRFTGPSELTGTSIQALTTTGIYRYSRNPQGVGYVTFLAGAAWQGAAAPHSPARG